MEVKNTYFMQTPGRNPSKDQKMVEFADGGRQFISYGFLIAEVDQIGRVRLSEHWACSATTVSYLNRFLGLGGLGKKEIQGLVDSGVYAIRKGPAPVIRKKGA